MLYSKSSAISRSAAGPAQRVLRAAVRPPATCQALSSRDEAVAQLEAQRVQMASNMASATGRIKAAAAAERVKAQAAADASAAAVTTAEGLLEVTQESWQAAVLDASADKLVVVDFFTDWCGPCKLIYPDLVKLSAELAPAATVVKFNCNQANKELAKTLGIKVAPTFQLYRGGQKVADMTGAKVDKLRSLIDEQLNQN